MIITIDASYLYFFVVRKQQPLVDFEQVAPYNQTSHLGIWDSSNMHNLEVRHRTFTSYL